MNVPLLDLRAQHESIRREIEQAVSEVIESQQFILGPQVRACEEAIAEYCGCAHAVGVSSGTDALLVSMMAEDIGPGDEVITTAYSFFATGGSISRLGARPVFVDIDLTSCNIDPAQIERRITSRTRAILPVHLFGQVSDMDPIMEVSRRRNLVVIEDAAQAIGAEYKGRRAGSMGDYGCFSFFPSKNLGAYGDGGMVVTNDPRRARKLRVLRAHGAEPKYHHGLVGGNFRLDTIQASVVLTKLKHLDRWTAMRQANARRYEGLFAAAGLVSEDRLTLPTVAADRHVFNQYVIRTSARDSLRAHLKDKSVGTEVYYPMPLHLQECFRALSYAPETLPLSERAARESLALPIYPELTAEQAQYVVETVEEFFDRQPV